MPRRKSSKALTLCFAQSAAGIIFGWGTSECSGLFSMRSYQSRFGENVGDGVYAISTSRQSAVTSVLSAGAAVGAVASGSIAAKFGLRRTCIAFILIHLVGAAIETSATSTYVQICIARVLTGLGIGATSGLVPVFQAEASPPQYRGLVTGSFQLCITLGIWGVSVLNWGMSQHDYSDISWRIPVGLQLVFSCLLLAGFVLSPESPRFLARQERWDECRASLASLRGLPPGDSAVELEMVEVRAAAASDKERGHARYSECFSATDRIAWRTMIGILVQVGQQLTGIIFFFSYGVQFAEAAGIANSYVFQCILASVNVAASFPGLYLVDRAGRRPVLLYGAATMFLGQIVVGAVSKAYPGSPIAGNILIAFTCVFIAAFAASWGPVAWVVCAETFPIRLSSLCVTLGTGANWLMNLLVSVAAPQIQARIGTGICFVWAGFLAMAYAFAFFCVPETRGMSIEGVDMLYMARVPAWRSKTRIRDEEGDDDAQNLPDLSFTPAGSSSPDHSMDSKPCGPESTAKGSLHV